MNYTASQQEIYIKQLRKLLSGKRNATRRSVTGSIVSLLGYSGEAIPSQTYLGSHAGVVRETVCRSLKTLHGSILVVTNRGYKKTCQYWLTSEFLNNRHHFYDLIPALRQISLLLLFSITSNVFSQNVTQYKEHNRAAPSKWKMVTVPSPDYEFYEARPSKKESITHLFINKQQQSSKNTHWPQRREVMYNEVVQLLAGTFNLNAEQQEQYSRYSNAVLLKTLQSFAEQRKIRKINSPHAWLAWVTADEARKEQEQGQRSPKMGKGMDSYQRKVVNATFNANHSAAPNAPNMSLEERIAFLNSEIANYERIIANPKDFFKANVDIGMALEVGMSRLKACQSELLSLQRPGAKPQPSSSLSNTFKKDYDIASVYSEGPEYEDHLDEVAKTMRDPEGYKDLVRRRDYRNTARR